MPCGGDLVIAPEHRKRGLTAQLRGALTVDLDSARCPYALSLSSTPDTRRSLLAIGWQSVGSLETMRREAGWLRLGRPVARYLAERWPRVRSFLRRLRSTRPDRGVGEGRRRPVDPFRALDRCVGRERSAGGYRIALDQQPRPDAMAELVERLGHDGRIRHVRDPQYFGWRFLNPRARYRFLYADSARLEGYLILAAQPGRPEWGVRLVDWEAVNDRVRRALLAVALRWGRFPSISTWTSGISPDTRHVLEDVRFRALEAVTSVTRPMLLAGSVPHTRISRDATIDGRHVLDLDDWDLREIDSDEA
jgi:hypothetical protein